MPSLWIPNAAAAALEFDERDSRIDGFTKRLQALDPRLDLLLATKTYPEQDIEMGFFYVRRHNEDGTVALWKIQNPDGTYREPDEHIIELFRKADANTGGGIHDFRRERDEWKAQQETNARHKREESYEKLKEQIDYSFRVQQPISRKPWEEAA